MKNIRHLESHQLSAVSYQHSAIINLIQAESWLLMANSYTRD